ncbi:3'-5' exoribonuclease domain-containing protein, partial [Streptomyces sp.]|uniref:3'-5' exoribonuclease domain-containing protein n=1 Tax=Streptomyces sp. TaxID=1931 RepID=UPI002F935396
DWRNHMPKSWLFDYHDPAVKRHSEIAIKVRRFIQDTPGAQLWAWYGAYDHVVLAQLFGRMVDLPGGVPMWTNDLQQETARLGNPQMPEQPAGVHNALADARHNRVRAHFLDSLA